MDRKTLFVLALAVLHVNTTLHMTPMSLSYYLIRYTYMCCRSEVAGRRVLVKEDNHIKKERDRSPAATVEGGRDSTRSLTRAVRWNEALKNIELVALDAGSSDEINPARSLFVSNLSLSVTHTRLVQFLVNDMIMSDKKMELAVRRVKKVRFLLDAAGQSRGRAFVEFDHVESALETADRVHRTVLQDRFVFVRLMNKE